jgi:cell division ATPase FtsA
LIDFGADTVKAVVVRKEKEGVRVLGYGFAPAEGHRLGGGRAEVAALAAITDGALVAAEDQTGVAGQPAPADPLPIRLPASAARRPDDRREAMGQVSSPRGSGGKVVPDEALVCIPARLARGESFTVRQARLSPSTPIAPREVKSAWERLARLARERLPALSDGSGPWKPLALTPGAVLVDGHRVTDPVGLKGQELALSAFGVAVWPSALQAARAIARRLDLALVDVAATPQALASLVLQREAILIEVGAEGTSLNLIQHAALVFSSWWPQGGEFFTQSMARAFRCARDEAEALKRAYSDGALSTADHHLAARALSQPVAAWLETLTAGLHRIGAVEAGDGRPDMPLDVARPGWLPGHVYLTGGGSLLPDLARALASLETMPDLSFRRSLEIEPLGSRLGPGGGGRMVLWDVPPHPAGDLLAPAISLATFLE